MAGELKKDEFLHRCRIRPFLFDPFFLISSLSIIDEKMNTFSLIYSSTSTLTTTADISSTT